MKLNLFIETNNYDPTKRFSPTPQHYFNYITSLFDKHALKQETMTIEQWNILEEILENKNIIEKELAPLKELFHFDLNIVGGSLRDVILNSTDKINDYDFTISCNFDLIKPLDDVAKDMGLSLNSLKDELNTITKARIDFAEKQCESQGFDLDRSSKQYLISTTKQNFYFSQIIHKLMENTKNYQYFSSKNVQDEYMNAHITSIHQFFGINNKKVDLIVTENSGISFLSTFDFEICKVYANLRNVKTKEQLLNKIVPLGSMLRDIEDKTFSFNGIKFPQENLQYFFNKHLLKLKEKYPDYSVNTFCSKKNDTLSNIEKERWIFSQYLILNHDISSHNTLPKKLKI